MKFSGNDRMSRQRLGFEGVIPFAQALIAENSEHMVCGTDWLHPAWRGFMPDDGALVAASDADARRDREIPQPGEVPSSALRF